MLTVIFSADRLLESGDDVDLADPQIINLYGRSGHRSLSLMEAVVSPQRPFPTHPVNLSRRRGSLSASDPYGTNAEKISPTGRLMSSRLSIYRLSPNNAISQPLESPNDANDDYLAVPASDKPRPMSTGSLPFTDFPQAPNSRRISFASSSFASSAPTTDSLISRASPAARRRNLTLSNRSRRNLTPQQVYDLAHCPVQSEQPYSHNPSFSQLTGGSALSGEEAELLTSPNSMRPTSFIPVPAGQILPFVDRPSEVAELIASSPTNRLMALLEHTFPAQSRFERPLDASEAEVHPSSGSTTSPIPSSGHHTPTPASRLAAFVDPWTWSYETLVDWMCIVPRSQIDDAEWVRRIRTCVMAHNEQICMSLLSALGAPTGDLDEDKELSSLSPHPGAMAPLRSISARSPSVDDESTGSIGSVKYTVDDSDGSHVIDISPITYETISDTDQRLAVRHSRSKTTSWTSSRSSSESSEPMESIRECESEGEELVSLAAVTSGVNESGPSTARGGSPVGAGVFKARGTGVSGAHRPSSLDKSVLSEQWNRKMDKRESALEDADAQEQEPSSVDWQGLRISTSPLPSPQPSDLPPVPASPMSPLPPTTLATNVRKKRRHSVNVAHVLSDAPGHAGFTWRPGGPLFPASFTAAGKHPNEDVVGSTLEGVDRELEASSETPSVAQPVPARRPKRSTTVSEGHSSGLM
ncbi:hypothetical protein EW146_g758 [Bondarzewia mesenterica]|uniref:Uncharacterized protein n=1 Tax=Bondarzewia mesenterica TaxID=1095465 RepID=A0A4S4M611_9AGAM|nr:hypothetical protein EW146_g758 [Bondarzewia mesenterica]